MAEVRALLSRHPIRTRLSLAGPMIVARDIAHAKIKERLDAGHGLPSYMRDFAVYYAGPAKTPQGMASGSFGPTTAGRMAAYVDQLQSAGGSLVMLAKGNRSPPVTAACKKHGGFYLGSSGGPAARLAQDCIKKVEVLEYPELGMEAVWKINVVDVLQTYTLALCFYPYFHSQKSASSAFISVLFRWLADEVEAQEVEFFVIDGFVEGVVDRAQVVCAVFSEGGQGLLLLVGRKV
jgi:tartrate/fumarate subfamily iron-sulfur-dependent hydro-lyase beta chain